MKTPFIVIALSGDKFVCPPMMIMADEHVIAINIAGASLAERLDAIPENTVLHSFNTDTDVTYAGEIDTEESEAPKQCADLVESPVISESDRARVYRPDELYFAVMEYPEGAEGSYVVIIS